MSRDVPDYTPGQGGRVDSIPVPEFRPQVLAIALSMAFTALGYLVWLGWHATKHLVPGTTSLDGPYESWQVVGLALSLGCLAVIGGWLGLVQSTALGAAVAVTLMFSVDAATQPAEDVNLWPVGAVLLLGTSAASLLVIAVCSRAFERRIGRSGRE